MNILKSNLLRALLISLATFTAYRLTQAPENPHLEHLIQAAAWHSGHFYVDRWANLLHEKVQYKGHWYEVHPPLSAAVFAVCPYSWLMASIVGTLSVVLMYRLTMNVWLTVFFGFGTNLWPAVTSADPWNATLILGSLMILATLWAMKRHYSPLWAGLFAGCAGLARYDLIPVAGLLWAFYPQWCFILSTLTNASVDGRTIPCGDGSEWTAPPWD